jgi:hypothetical protein
MALRVVVVERLIVQQLVERAVQQVLLLLQAQ